MMQVTSCFYASSLSHVEYLLVFSTEDLHTLSSWLSRVIKDKRFSKSHDRQTFTGLTQSYRVLLIEKKRWHFLLRETLIMPYSEDTIKKMLPKVRNVSFITGSAAVVSCTDFSSVCLFFVYSPFNFCYFMF